MYFTCLLCVQTPGRSVMHLSMLSPTPPIWAYRWGFVKPLGQRTHPRGINFCNTLPSLDAPDILGQCAWWVLHFANGFMKMLELLQIITITKFPLVRSKILTN